MPTIEIDFSVYCDTCGRGICNQVNSVNGTNIYVEACPTCMEAIKDEGYKEGYDEGYAESLEDRRG